MRRATELVAAFVALGLFFALGYRVRAHGEPALFVAWESALFDHATLVAWWVTWSCYVDVLVPIGIVLCILAWRLPAWRTRIILTIVTLLISWRAADFFQHLFARARPVHWAVRHETAFSYPSSHAAIVAGFYALWAALLYASELPQRVRLSASWALGILCIAILWSRLALGAHYITDLAGGVLLGGFVALLGLAIVGGRSGASAGRLSRATE